MTLAGMERKKEPIHMIQEEFAQGTRSHLLVAAASVHTCTNLQFSDQKRRKVLPTNEICLLVFCPEAQISAWVEVTVCGKISLFEKMRRKKHPGTVFHKNRDIFKRAERVKYHFVRHDCSKTKASNWMEQWRRLLDTFLILLPNAKALSQLQTDSRATSVPNAF